MSPATRTALLGSIAKWESIVSGNGIDAGIANCPLCAAFYEKGCKGCPVAAATGIEGCRDSPYQSWAEHQEDQHATEYNSCIHPDCPECLQLAQAELDFLKSLLEPQS